MAEPFEQHKALDTAGEVEHVPAKTDVAVQRLKHRSNILETLNGIDPSLAPSVPARFDEGKLQDWLNEDPDPEVRALKEKIMGKVKHVSHKEFTENLRRVTDDLNKRLEKIKEPYAVLWDYKPHSSRRWTHEQAKPFLKTKPVTATYFQGAAEKRTQALRRLTEKDIRHFVIFDDASYSGTQLQKTIREVREFHVKNGLEKPKFTIVAPYVTSTAAALISEPDVTLLSAETMPYIRDVLSKEDLEAISRKGFMDTKLHATGGKRVFDSNVTLTFFDHCVADSHSFAERLQPLIGEYQKPYGKSDSEYAKREGREFQEYFHPKEEV
jgi:hypothetical protein